MNCVVLALCSLLLLQSLSGPSWQRVVISGKGQHTDFAKPHPLNYFTGDPFQRDDGGDFCLSCNPSDTQNLVAAAEVQPTGELSGFKIFGIFYRFHNRQEAAFGPLKWKSLLVQTGPDLYVEIYHLQAYYTIVSLRPCVD